MTVKRHGGRRFGYNNNWTGVLPSGIDGSVTSIGVTAADPEITPGTDVGYFATIYTDDGSKYGTNHEIVFVTAITGTAPNLTLTVVRGAGSFAAVSHAADSVIEARYTAEMGGMDVPFPIAPILDVGDSGALDLDLSHVFHVGPLTGATSITLSNVPAGDQSSVVTVIIDSDFAVTWPGSVIWTSGAAPVLDSTVDNVIMLLQVGADFYGVEVYTG